MTKEIVKLENNASLIGQVTHRESGKWKLKPTTVQRRGISQNTDKIRNTCW